MTDRPSAPISATPKLSRREFARRAAVASAVASIAPVGAVSAELASGGTQTPTPQPANPPSSPAALPQLPPNMPKLSPESQTEADARFQTILALYGSRFSDEQKSDLRRLCVVAQPPLDRLRAYKVENGDGPGVYLKPLFEREKKPKPPPAPKPAAAASGLAGAASAQPAAKSTDTAKAPASGAAKKP